MVETSGTSLLGAIFLYLLSSLELGVPCGTTPSRSELCPQTAVNGSIVDLDLRITNCTADLIGISYSYDLPWPDYYDSILTISYSCELLNGTKLAEDEILICHSSTPSDTRYIDSDWMTEQYGAASVSCQFYGCIFFKSLFTETQYMNVLPVTCSTLEGDESCEEYCQRVGTEGCRMDISNVTQSETHSGYQCTCPTGYVWNATHCENIDECQSAETNNCSGPGSWCLDLEGNFTCVQCTDEEEWNRSSCVPLPGATTGPSNGVLDASTLMTLGTPTSRVLLQTTAGPTTESTVPNDSSTLSAPELTALFMFAAGAIALAILASIILLYLYCKRVRRKRRVPVYREKTNPYYVHYPQEDIDMTFEPLDSIYPLAIPILPSFSIGSHLDILWEKPCQSTATDLVSETSQQYKLGEEGTLCEDHTPNGTVSNPDRDREDHATLFVSIGGNIDRYFTDADSYGYVDVALSDRNTSTKPKEEIPCDQ